MPRLASMRTYLRLLPVFAACVAGSAAARAPQVQSPFPAQTQGTPRNQRSSPQTLPSDPNGDSASDPFRATMEARRLRMQNDDRYRRLVTDTERLYALSSELKEDINKSTKNELSLDVIKKAAEIEKLAHDVRERMRN